MNEKDLSIKEEREKALTFIQPSLLKTPKPLNRCMFVLLGRLGGD